MVFKNRVADLEILIKCFLAICVFFGLLFGKNLKFVIFYLGYVLLLLNVVNERLLAVVWQVFYG